VDRRGRRGRRLNRGLPPRGVPALQTWLEAPEGSIIRPGDAGTTQPNVQFVYGDWHFYFRVQFPVFPGQPDAQIGLWAHMAYTHVSGAESANVPFIYSAIVKARSDLLLRGFIAQNTYGPGSPMNVVLEPALYGQPVMFEDTVEVTAERPNGVTRVVPLNQNACGQYEGTLTDTRLVGPYRFTARVDATTPHGNQITRYRSLTAGRVVAFVRDVFAQPLGGPPRPFASLRLPAMVSPQPGRAALR
jgi:hypothetical protein